MMMGELPPVPIDELTEATLPEQGQEIIGQFGGVPYRIPKALLAAIVEEILVERGNLVPSARQISTGSGLEGGGDLTADLELAISEGGVSLEMLADVPPAHLLGRPKGANGGAPAKLSSEQVLPVLGSGTPSAENFLRGDGSWAFPFAITAGSSIAAAGTEVQFGGVPAGARRITIGVSGVRTNGTSPFVVQLGDAGGIETSGYSDGAGFITSSSPSTTNSAGSGFVICAPPSSAALFSGVVTLINIGGNVWVLSSVLGSSSSSATFAAGTKTLSGPLTSLRLRALNGTDVFQAGQINVVFD
ncbi:MAG: hypothetical protein LAT55_13280 [Opitutales bacterium]|nr:hypothetical protein [Opitutales bacterium]